MFYFIFAGTYKITESFLYPIGQLAVDPRIYVLIQKEVYNSLYNFFRVTLNLKDLCLVQLINFLIMF